MPRGQPAKGEGGALQNLASLNSSLNSMSHDFLSAHVALFV